MDFCGPQGMRGVRGSSLKQVVFAAVQGAVNFPGPRKHILNLVDSARSQEPSSPTHLHVEMQSHRLLLLLKPCRKETPLPAAPAYFAHCNQSVLLN